MTLGQTFKLKGLLEIFYNIENAKGKMLEASPSLERSMTICHSLAKKLTLGRKLHDRKKGSTVQRTLDTLITKKWNALILKVANVLNYSVLNKY